MGQKISTSNIQSIHKVNDVDLRFRIIGPIQDNANNKVVKVIILGALYKESKKMNKVSNELKEEFMKFVKTDRFKAYITNNLFQKNSDFEKDFPYFVEQNTIDDINWTLVSVPSATFQDNSFTLSLDFQLSGSENERHTLRSCVIYMSKSFINALENRRAEVMPIIDKDGVNVKFGPDEISFELENK